jgi:hypothetical protein
MSLIKLPGKAALKLITLFSVIGGHDAVPSDVKECKHACDFANDSVLVFL